MVKIKNGFKEFKGKRHNNIFAGIFNPETGKTIYAIQNQSDKDIENYIFYLIQKSGFTINFNFIKQLFKISYKKDSEIYRFLKDINSESQFLKLIFNLKKNNKEDKII